MSLDGKVALVTGATQGLGKETALGLAHLGAHVAHSQDKGAFPVLAKY